MSNLMKPMKLKNMEGAQGNKLYYDERFQHRAFLGRGAYGEVYEVVHRETNKKYAIKKYTKIFDSRILALRTLRELTILRRIKHQRIIKIYDILPPKNMQNYQNLEVVLEYLPFDLRKLCGKNQYLSDEDIPKVTYQLLTVLKYLSKIKILHRDLKPQNILSDHSYNIKLCDFGLARPGATQPTFDDVRKGNRLLMTSHVVSRWYRAPEIILMQNMYDQSIEMWSVGCIFGELIADHSKNKKATKSGRKALFEGKACFPLSPPKQEKDCTYKMSNGFPHSEDDQISKILQIIGSPTQQQASFIKQQVAANYIKSLPKYQKKRPSEIFDYCRPQWEDFLNKALVFDPRKRMTIDEALQHPIFDNLRNPEDFEFTEGENLDLFLPSELSMEEIKAQLKKQILYYRQGKMQQEF